MKKRISLLLSVIVFVAFCLSACGASTGTKEYREAVSKLEETRLTEDGTYLVSEELVIASQEAEYTEPKNIIYMIGDGMGINIVETTREYYAEELYEGMMAIDLVPQVGWHCSYSADAQVTDSAAGGTALSTGYKTSNGTIAMDKMDKNTYQTVLELAAEKGMNTGIVATKAVTDATPASFTAHVTDRSLQEEIAAQQIQMMVDGDLDLVMGGGLIYYSSGKNLSALKDAQSQGVTYANDWEHTVEAELPFVGLYALEHIYTYNTIVPTLAEMTNFALEKLSENNEGFFLMVEGSQIDTKAHANSYLEETKEMYDFDCAIGIALKFVAMNPDTVLIITADHETGGLHLPMESTENIDSNYYYTTDSHTSIQVPVYAIGYGVEQLSGIKENVDVARFVASLLGESDFGQQSKVHSLMTDFALEKLTITFDETNYRWNLPKDAFLSDFATIQNARAIHIKMKNVGPEKVHLPVLVLKGADIEAYVAPQVDYLDVEEKMILTYVLTGDCWENRVINMLDELYLSYELCAESEWKQYLLDTTFEDVTFEIEEIWITDRGLDN